MNKQVLFISNAIAGLKTISNNTYYKLKHNLQNKIFKKANNLLANESGFGMNEVLGIALAIIVAAFVIIPELRNLSENIISRLTTWWTTVSGKIFLTS